MNVREGACEVCTAFSLSAYRDRRVRIVAKGNGVVIRHCSVCGAYWDEQSAGRPLVISREEASRRVPDASGWWTVGPLLVPSNPTRLLVDVQRQDAHQGDVWDLHRQTELPGDATAQDVLTQVVEPFLHNAPRTTWRCRARIAGEWVDIAKMPTGRGPAQLYVPVDSLARELSGQALLEIVCKSADHP